MIARIPILDNGKCVRHKKYYSSNYNDTIDWRNEDVKRIINRLDLKNINYVDGNYEMTKPMYNMHTVKYSIIRIYIGLYTLLLVSTILANSLAATDESG